MSTTPHSEAHPPVSHRSFDRVVCGVDGSPESLDAVRQALAIAARDAELTLITVIETGLVAAGWISPMPLAGSEPEMRAGAERVLEDTAAGVSAVHAIRRRVGVGPPGVTLVAEASHEDAQLLAVGLRGHSRASGILTGSVATTVLHDAACSTLIARQRTGSGEPRSIVVGVDGSASSLLALDTACRIAARDGSSVTALAATGGRELELEALRTAVAERQLGLTLDPAGAVEALVRHEADLTVVGSRGLQGIRALGSVSEAVGHRAHGSVLVVR
jgi:nucleotide-binding universal stress UspA family protein